MRILHTSDWHVGRSFHQHSTLEALGVVADFIADSVTAHGIDVVVAAGDIYDSSTPSADAVALLNKILGQVHDAGAQVVMIAGNHDSATRLGTMSSFAAAAGVHIITRHDQITAPVVLTDAHGEVRFYGIPFLEPARLRSVWTDVDMRTQRDALNVAMDVVRSDAASHNTRSVVIAHTFAQGADSESCDSERDIVSNTSGGVDKVPVSTFDGVDYVALGHIHGRMRLADNVRYSGAPLLYSFSEAQKPRGGWIVDFDDTGFVGAEWLDFPIPRPAITLTGTIDDVLSAAEYSAYEQHWVRARLTDQTRPLDAMRKLQGRFPFCVDLVHEPATTVEHTTAYADLVRGRTDAELIDAFLERVRNGEGTTPDEAQLIDDVLSAHNAKATA